MQELRAFAESENITLEEVLSKFEQHYIEEYTQGMTGTMTTAMGKMFNQSMQSNRISGR